MSAELPPVNEDHPPLPTPQQQQQDPAATGFEGLLEQAQGHATKAESGDDKQADEASQALRAEAIAAGFNEELLDQFDEQTLTHVLAEIDRRAIALIESAAAPMQGGAGLPMPGLGQPLVPQGQSYWPLPAPPAPAFPGNNPSYPGWPMPNQMQPGLPGMPPQMPGQMQPGLPGQQPPPQFQLPKIDEDLYGKELSEALKSMHEYYNGQLSQLNAALQQQQQLFYTQAQSAAQQQADQYAAWFDDKVSALGEEYMPLLGKGSIDRLPQHSAHYQNRLKLDDTIARLSRAYPHATSDELFSRAVRALWPQAEKSVANKRISDQLSARSAKTIGRPRRVTKGKVDDPNDIDPETGAPRSFNTYVADLIASYHG